jgi:hypothetical protein
MKMSSNENKHSQAENDACVHKKRGLTFFDLPSSGASKWQVATFSVVFYMSPAFE